MHMVLIIYLSFRGISYLINDIIVFIFSKKKSFFKDFITKMVPVVGLEPTRYC